MKNIYIDDLQIHDNSADIGYFCSPPIAGLDTPTLRVVERIRPGEHGAFMSNLLYGPRHITLEGIIHASTISQFETRRRALEAVLSVNKDTRGVPVAKTLKLETVGGLQLQVGVHVMNFKLNIEYLAHARFFIELYAEYFALESQNLKAPAISIPSGGGVIYPVIYPVIYGASSGGMEIVNNAGTVEAFPIVEFQGPLTNPFIKNVDLGRTIELNINIANGETIVVNMREKTILKGSQSFFNNLVSGSQFWWLNPGESTILFGTGSGSDTGQAVVKFRDSYLGA